LICILILGPACGFVFCTIHNIQANTPIQNVLAMFEAVQEYR
jgi:uroporphyrinogen-III decarboxylase